MTRRAGQGLMVAGLLALPVFAESAPAPVGTRIDPDNLVRFNERDYTVAHQDWVDSTPLSVSHVTKIGFGRVSQVDVATTTTGVYSSEAMFSPNVRYPGVKVSPAGFAQGFSVIRAGDVMIINAGPLRCIASRSFAIC